MSHAGNPGKTAAASTLELWFEDLHPDAEEMLDDASWSFCFVAGAFGVRVGDVVLFEEGEFPVLELASALEGWLEHGRPADVPLDYEVSGGAAGTLTIRRAPGGWSVDSVHREDGTPPPSPITDAAVVTGVRGFIDDLARETALGHRFDVRAFLRRVRTR